MKYKNSNFAVKNTDLHELRNNSAVLKTKI